jgi:hypothetical protein
MNFLELCQRVRQEAGVAGSGPTTVVTQTGQLGKIVGWTAQAWVEIQLLRPNWNFMNESFSFATVAATRDYLAADYSITDLKLWDYDSFLIYETAIGESDQNELTYYPYKVWRPRYRNRMNDRNDDRPQLFTILQNNNIRFEPRPDKAYTIEGEYKRTTQEFTADADIPTNLPDDFHMIIVWQALKYYGFYENAPEVLDEAETNFDNLLFRLEAEQLPEMSEDFEAIA